MKENTHFEPEVIEACRQRFDDCFDTACRHFGETVSEAFTFAQIADLASAADLCAQVGLEAGWSDEGTLLVITPFGKPAAIQGPFTVAADVPTRSHHSEWDRKIPFAD